MIKSGNADKRGGDADTRRYCSVALPNRSVRVRPCFCPRSSALSLLAAWLIAGCGGSRDSANETRSGTAPAPDSTLFTRMPSSFTGVRFANRLTDTREFNVFTYRNFYNGGGVAIGDLTGDGLPEVVLTANQDGPKLFLNEGQFRFRDVTKAAGLERDTRAWTTGVTLADVNGDGRLDIYICHAGNVPPAERANALWINEGPNEDSVPTFQRASACVRRRGRRICDALRLSRLRSRRRPRSLSDQQLAARGKQLRTAQYTACARPERRSQAVSQRWLAASKM